MFDVIIIGAGPAGISASLYTKRANLKTMIIYQNNSNLEKAELIENYYNRCRTSRDISKFIYEKSKFKNNDNISK